MHWIGIEQFSYCTSLNLDLVWTDLQSAEHEACEAKTTYKITQCDNSLLKKVGNWFGTITQTHHACSCRSCARKQYTQHPLQVYMKCNGYHGYSAQALIALKITLGCARVVKTEISNNNYYWVDLVHNILFSSLKTQLTLLMSSLLFWMNKQSVQFTSLHHNTYFDIYNPEHISCVNTEYCQ